MSSYNARANISRDDKNFIVMKHANETYVSFTYSQEDALFLPYIRTFLLTYLL